MKIKMKINPIEIDTKDAWKFGLIALLVDREDFLQDVELSRKALGIKTILSRKDVKKKMNDTDDALTAEEYKKLTDGQKKTHDNLHMKLIASTPYDDTVISLMKKYHRSNSFQEIIRFSILCGEVQDDDLIVPQPIPFSANPKKNITYIPIHYPQIAIIVNPETNPEEVRKYFVESRKFTMSPQNPYQNMSYFIDTKTRIKEHRDWYWQYKKIGIAKLCVQLAKKQISVKTVEKAVYTYQKLLNKKIFK